MSTSVVDTKAKVADIPVAPPANLPVPASPAPLPVIKPEKNTQLAVGDPELRQTQMTIGKLRLWRGFIIENVAGVGFLAAGFHDMAASAAFVPVMPAWQTVALGLLALGLGGPLVEIISNKFGAPKQ